MQEIEHVCNECTREKNNMSNLNKCGNIHKIVFFKIQPEYLPIKYKQNFRTKNPREEEQEDALLKNGRTSSRRIQTATGQ
jgi:hypothetical protein